MVESVKVLKLDVLEKRLELLLAFKIQNCKSFHIFYVDSNEPKIEAQTMYVI